MSKSDMIDIAVAILLVALSGAAGYRIAKDEQDKSGLITISIEATSANILRAFEFCENGGYVFIPPGAYILATVPYSTDQPQTDLHKPEQREG